MYYLFDLGRWDNNIAIKLHVEEDRIVLNEREHLLSDIKNRSDFTAYCKMTFPLKQLSVEQRTVQDKSGGSHSYPYSLDPLDMFTFTSNTKYKPNELNKQTAQDYSVSFIFFPHHVNFKDAFLNLLKPTDPNVVFEITTKDSKNNVVEYVPDKVITEVNGWDELIFPKCSLDIVDQTVENGVDVYTLEFMYNDIDGKPISCDFYAAVKSTKGYLTNRKIDLVNGKARFKYVPLYVDKGEKSVIQVGIGNYSHIAKIII